MAVDICGKEAIRSNTHNSLQDGHLLGRQYVSVLERCLSHLKESAVCYRGVFQRGLPFKLIHDIRHLNSKMSEVKTMSNDLSVGTKGVGGGANSW